MSLKISRAPSVLSDTSLQAQTPSNSGLSERSASMLNIIENYNIPFIKITKAKDTFISVQSSALVDYDMLDLHILYADKNLRNHFFWISIDKNNHADYSKENIIKKIQEQVNKINIKASPPSPQPRNLQYSDR